MSGVAEAAAGAFVAGRADGIRQQPVTCRCRSPAQYFTTLRKLPDVSPLVHSRCLVREKKVTLPLSMVLSKASGFI